MTPILAAQPPSTPDPSHQDLLLPAIPPPLEISWLGVNWINNSVRNMLTYVQLFQSYFVGLS